MTPTDRSRQYEAFLIIIGLAYIKMVEIPSEKRKEAFQKVIDSLMEEISKIE